MAQKIGRHREPAAAAAPTAPPARFRWRRVLVGAAIVIVAGAVAALSHAGWRNWTLPQRIAPALATEVDSATLPPVLAEKLTRARATASERSTALAGLAELGRLYHANSRYREAETCWRLLAAEEPGQPRWVYYLSHARRAANAYDDVGALLRRTLELEPEYAPALLQLAEIEFKNGNVDVAEGFYRRRLAQLPADPYAGLGLARVALQRDQRDVARERLAQICRDVPDFSSSHNLYAEVLAAEGDQRNADRHRWLGREAGRFREAADPWLDELEAWCFEPGRLRMLATMAHQTGDNERALRLLQRALEIAPGDRQTYESLGDLYLKIPEPEAARDILRRGLDLESRTQPSPRAFVNLSQAYRLLKDPPRSLAAADEGVARLPDAYEVHDARGMALAELGRRDEAIAAFQRALELRPNDANTNFNLALTLLAAERADEARLHLERSLTLEPTFLKSLTLMADLEMNAGRLEAAGKLLERIFASAPGMPRARQLMGAWHLKSGAAAEAKQDLAAAERHYREGWEIDPESAELAASLGVFYLVQNRFADALRPLESYRRLAPENAQSALFLGQVYLALGRLPDARRILEAGVTLAERQGNKTTAEHCREILQHLAQLR